MKEMLLWNTTPHRNHFLLFNSVDVLHEFDMDLKYALDLIL